MSDETGNVPSQAEPRSAVHAGSATNSKNDSNPDPNPNPAAQLSPDPTQDLVTQIARALVDHPESVEVQALVREESTVLRLHVSESDIGKVIGKQGRTAHSLRTILSAVSMKYHHRYTLDIVETASAERDEHARAVRGGHE